MDSLGGTVLYSTPLCWFHCLSLQRHSGSFFLPQGKTTAPQANSTAAPTAASGTLSYSAELFSCFSDLASSDANKNGTEVTQATSQPSSSSTIAVGKPAVVSYVGSSQSGSTETVKAPQPMPRSVTDSKLTTPQDTAQALSRSKTVGGLPSVPNIVAARSAAVTLANKKDDSLPIAVAFIESVNAMFFGSDKSRWVGFVYEQTTMAKWKKIYL